MKIALVHDHLMEFGGAERVLVALHNVFPEAPVYTAYYRPESLGVHTSLFQDWDIRTSWADKIPGIRRLHSPLRFLYPLIWESFDFSEYDVVISSSGTCMSKGIITKPHTRHISYVHHPPRYLYYYETAIEWQKYIPIRIYGHIINQKLRMWDYLSSQRVDTFIANSIETKRRIEKFYRRNSEVIYPPVFIPKICKTSKTDKRDTYITVSRLARSKHIDALIKTANAMKLSLKIIGNGRDAERLQQLAGPTVNIIPSVTDEELRTMYTHAKAFLFAGVDEEFGIAPIEAMGHGVPVIAYASGGLKETVIQGKNGYLVEECDFKSFIHAIKKFETLSTEEHSIMRRSARLESEKYLYSIFEKKIKDLVIKNDIQ